MTVMLRSRLLGVISPMIVWSLYFVAVYALQGLGCAQGWHRQSLAGLNALSAALGGLTLATLAVLAVLGRIGWTGWRRAGTGGGSGAATGFDSTQRQRAVGLLMLLLALLAFIATVLIGVALPFAIWSARVRREPFGACFNSAATRSYAAKSLRGMPR